MKKAISVVLMVIVLFVGAIFAKWYQFVAYAATPIDEVGIGLSQMMPSPIQDWGCAKLHERFKGDLVACQRNSLSNLF